MAKLDLEKMFEAGARSFASESGLCEKDADAVSEMCKQARRRRQYDEDDDEDEGTWWSRNKGWVLPSSIGLGAFLLGGSAGRYGRPDWNHFANAGRLTLEALQKLLGIPNSAYWRSMTKADPRKIAISDAKSKETKELDDLLSSKYDVPKTKGGSTGPLFGSTLPGRMGEIPRSDRALVIHEPDAGETE